MYCNIYYNRILKNDQEPLQGAPFLPVIHILQFKNKAGSNDAIPSFSANTIVIKGSDQKSLPIHKPTGPLVPQGTGIFGTDKGHSDLSHPGDQAPSFHSVNTLLPGSNSEQ